VGRYGGEEFLIVLNECTTSDLVATAERMRVCVSESPIETEVGPIPVTFSIGLAVSAANAAVQLTGEDLLRVADTALYRAKTNGRNRVESAPEIQKASPSHAAAHQ